VSPRDFQANTVGGEWLMWTFDTTRPEWEAAWFDACYDALDQVRQEVRQRVGSMRSRTGTPSVFTNYSGYALGITVRRNPGSTWFSRLRATLTVRDIEFVRLYPDSSSQHLLTLGIATTDPTICAAIRTQFQAHADAVGVKLNYLY